MEGEQQEAAAEEHRDEEREHRQGKAHGGPWGELDIPRPNQGERPKENHKQEGQEGSNALFPPLSTTDAGTQPYSLHRRPGVGMWLSELHDQPGYGNQYAPLRSIPPSASGSSISRALAEQPDVRALLNQALRESELDALLW